MGEERETETERDAASSDAGSDSEDDPFAGLEDAEPATAAAAAAAAEEESSSEEEEEEILPKKKRIFREEEDSSEEESDAAGGEAGGEVAAAAAAAAVCEPAKGPAVRKTGVCKKCAAGYRKMIGHVGPHKGAPWTQQQRDAREGASSSAS